MQIKLGCYRVGNIWKSQQDIFNFLVSHFRFYHQMEIQDVYKLFYQGVEEGLEPCIIPGEGPYHCLYTGV
ncbi:MAG: hypothetical protein XD73_0805, partial [Anaerolinea thermophila]